MSSPTNTKLRVENFTENNGPDNQDGYTLADRQGGLLVSGLNPSLYSWAVRGKLFHGMSVTAGHVVPADNATAPTYALFNPAGSGYNAVITAFRLGTITLGTRAVSAFGFNFVHGLGSAAATGTGCTAFASTPTGIVGPDMKQASGSSAMLFSNTGTVTVTATTSFYTLGLSHDLATTGEAFDGVYKFDGDLILEPGSLMFPATHAAASGSTYLMQLTWIEVPVL